MKRLLTFSLLSFLGVSTLIAAPLPPVTLLVMDSTDALLPKVQVRILSSDAPSYTVITSWDGIARIEGAYLPAELELTDAMHEVSGAMRDTLHISLTAEQAGQTLIVRMGPLHYPSFSYGESEYVYSGGMLTGRPAPSASKSKGKGSAKRKSKSAAKASKTSSVTPRSKRSAEEPSHPLVEYSVRLATTSESVMKIEGEDAEVWEDAVSFATDAGTPSSPSPKAGSLTAGEVNDFSKWALWPNILFQSHAAYVSDWRLQPHDRYVVLLTSPEGYPLADQPVRLTDAEGRILFEARTDNTGKAELWDHLTALPAPGQPCTKPAQGPRFVEVEGLRQAIAPFHGASEEGANKQQGICHLQRVTPCTAPDTADVFFIFDATGSMGDELRYLKAEMQDVIQRSQNAVPGLTIRTGALVYRDHNDEYLTRIARLGTDISATQAFIDKQEAGGGGDYPEAIPEALMASLNAADWSPHARARIAFLILDAPCHQDSTTIALLHQQVRQAAAQGVRLVPVVCSGLQPSGELLMRSLALATNGTSFFLTDDSGIGGTHLKPTTDTLAVEHLNDMLVRTIIRFTQMPDCQTEQWSEEALEEDAIDAFVANPFDLEDLADSTHLEPLGLDSLHSPALEPIPLQEVLQVRPNPCSGFSYASLPLGADALYLTDLSGKTLESLGPQEATAERYISTEHLSAGIYFVQAFYAGHWYTQKLIVTGR